MFCFAERFLVRRPKLSLGPATTREAGFFIRRSDRKKHLKNPTFAGCWSTPCFGRRAATSSPQIADFAMPRDPTARSMNSARRNEGVPCSGYLEFQDHGGKVC